VIVKERGKGLANWGAALTKLEQYSEAQQYLETAQKIFQALGDRRNEAETLKNLAELHHKTGQPDRAREYCDAALALAIELGIPLIKNVKNSGHC
jgi:tetratricopeptide (TPR) repeat protein